MALLDLGNPRLPAFIDPLLGCSALVVGPGRVAPKPSPDHKRGGTRRPTDYGKRMCQQLIEALASCNPLLVSGFAYGVDILAQTYAAQLGLATVGCTAQGLDRIYPAKHQKHLAAILAHWVWFRSFCPPTLLSGPTFYGVTASSPDWPTPR